MVDRDFRTEAQVRDLEAKHGIFALPVHEIENFFLHPQTLTVLIQQNGLTAVPEELILCAADKRAGNWIFQHAMWNAPKALPEFPLRAKEYAKSLIFNECQEDNLNKIVEYTNFEVEDAAKLKRLLEISKRSYERKRLEGELWKVCEGKQVLSELARSCNYTGVAALITASCALWTRDPSKISAELASLRSYLARL